VKYQSLAAPRWIVLRRDLRVIPTIERVVYYAGDTPQVLTFAPGLVRAPWRLSDWRRSRYPGVGWLRIEGEDEAPTFPSIHGDWDP
jgi:hypothetical protein